MLQQVCKTKGGLIGYQNTAKAQDTLATGSKADKSHVLRELQFQQIFVELSSFQLNDKITAKTTACCTTTNYSNNNCL